ncbi:MAG: SIR2 family protein [Candidatus Thiodiazotropha sp.]
MTLPVALLNQMKKGKVVLLLGSGALYGATIPGKDIPFGDGLRDILCDEFLDESFKGDSLAHVSAIAISQNSLFVVQDFIKDYFSTLEPASFHLKIPNYKWRALFTTNYDRLIETCYEKNGDRVQNYVLMLSNGDKIDETRVTNDKVPLVKLHGCITRTHDESLPLILTIDQYNESLVKRKRLFDHLYDLAYENSIVFVGHSLQDHNIRSVMLMLRKEAPSGQRHYLIKPSIKDVERDYWAEQKITALGITFEEFLSGLDSGLSDAEKVLSLVRPSAEHSIQGRFCDNLKPSDELLRFLSDNVEYISNKIDVVTGKPQEFYRGVNQGWFPVATGLSIKRNLEDKVFESIIEKPEASRSSKAELFVIKGEAGSGKSIFLRQIAWRAKEAGIGIFLWVKQGEDLDFDLIEEIQIRTKERVYIIWDDAAINAVEIEKFIIKARKRNVMVTVITAERYNEWNVRCEELDKLLNDDFTLRYLSESEIEDLLDRLEEHNSLGPNLTPKNKDQRKHELREIHGRQLLVALHEATMGEPFEDIVYSEYNNIMPQSAKVIYLTVCVLNRMRVPVRAGLISRIHDISFEKFSSLFHKPLEKVVLTLGGSDSDIHYVARHPEIAEIVFRRALTDVKDRYREYIGVLSKLNPSYSSDHASFRSLIRAKSLHELFPSYDDVKGIYDQALDSFGEEPYLLQQMANYERIRPNGNLEYATELLERANLSAPYDSSILHTIAVVWRDRSLRTKDSHMRVKYRGEARAYLEKASEKWGVNNYISATKIELSIDALQDVLDDSDSTSYSINESIRTVQQELSKNKQIFPADGHVHSLEARFSQLLDNHDAALNALEKSFKEKGRDPYIAIRVASTYKERGNYEKAEDILIRALERRRSDHKLNFHYAELIRNKPETDVSTLMYYYRRAFTPGDSNYHAQFWFARFAYESTDKKDVDLAKSTFEKLRNAHISYRDKIEVRDFNGGHVNPNSHFGAIVKKKQGFGFISVDGSGEEIFCPPSSVLENLWEAVQEGDRVKFEIGYSFSGVLACNVAIA